MSINPSILYNQIRIKYLNLIKRYNYLVKVTLRNKNTFRRLMYNYQVVKRSYIILRRYATKKVAALLNHIQNQKYQLVLDEYKNIIKIPRDFLELIEISQEDFLKSFYLDMLFEKFMPPPDPRLAEIPIPGFRFPFIVNQEPSEDESLFPFVHFQISGKIARENPGGRYLYFLNMENISSTVELEYFQKTDSLINSLTTSNYQLLNAKKTIEMHKRMLISLTCSLIGEYSRETSEHLKNMEFLTTHLTLECKRLGLIHPLNYDPDEYIKDIVYTSVLHDIGKMAIPRTILEKDDILTPDEKILVKQHPQIGADYIKKIMDGFSADPLYSSYCSFLQIPWEICLYHHERWDGGGYPEGLSGENIPIAARIISLVDTYEALRGTRKYNHQPRTHDQALNIIKKESGQQFDPQIVDAFISINYKFSQIHAPGV